MGAFSADMIITYDPAVLAVGPPPSYGVTLGPVGMSNGSTLLVNQPVAGQLNISLFSTTPFSGAGALVDLNFNVIGLPGTSSAVSFAFFQYNAPCPGQTTNGSVSVISGTITGSVTYGNILGPPSPRGVPNVMLNASGSPSVSDVTDAFGAYSMSGFGAGAYKVTPSKTGGVNNAISAFDASMIAQHTINTMSFTPQQQFVADVSGSDGITSFDATLVARYVVLLPPPGTFSASTGDWRFAPSSRKYPDVFANISDENYSALLMGEVSGNWNDPNSLPKRMANGPVRSIAVTAPQLAAKPDSQITIPIEITGMLDNNIIAYEFELKYDPAVIQPQANPVALANTVSRDLRAVANAQTPGSLRVAVFGTAPVSDNGVLLNLNFTAVGEQGAVSPLKWESLLLNEGDPRVLPIDGQIELVRGAPNQAEISGRLLSAYGTGVPHTIVKLTDTTGLSVSALTDESGAYRFGGLRIGETYTLTSGAQRLRFTPLTISVADQAVNVDLIAEP